MTRIVSVVVAFDSSAGAIGRWRPASYHSLGPGNERLRDPFAAKEESWIFCTEQRPAGHGLKSGLGTEWKRQRRRRATEAKDRGEGKKQSRADLRLGRGLLHAVR